MDHADSTTNVGNSRLHLFNAYQNKNFKPFLEDMTEEYVEEDNIKFPLTDYSNWIATPSIPKYYDENLWSNSTLKLNAITLKNYLRKFILIIKEKLSKNCSWEEPERITSMSREDFDKKCKHEQGRGNMDVTEDT